MATSNGGESDMPATVDPVRDSVIEMLAASECALTDALADVTADRDAWRELALVAIGAHADETRQHQATRARLASQRDEYRKFRASGKRSAPAPPVVSDTDTSAGMVPA
jgi:hypothetical protein